MENLNSIVKLNEFKEDDFKNIFLIIEKKSGNIVTNNASQEDLIWLSNIVDFNDFIIVKTK